MPQQDQQLETHKDHCSLDLKHDPLMHIIEERSKENPKPQQSQPITTEYGELHWKWAGQVSLSNMLI